MMTMMISTDLRVHFLNNLWTKQKIAHVHRHTKELVNRQDGQTKSGSLGLILWTALTKVLMIKSFDFLCTNLSKNCLCKETNPRQDRSVSYGKWTEIAVTTFKKKQEKKTSVDWIKTTHTHTRTFYPWLWQEEHGWTYFCIYQKQIFICHVTAKTGSAVNYRLNVVCSLSYTRGKCFMYLHIHIQSQFSF